MKFFIAFAALVAVAVATPVLKPETSEAAELEAIIAAIQSPNTDPATAGLLEELLEQIIGAVVNPEPIAVGPAIIENEPISVGPAIIESQPISVGPAIIDFPLPDGGAVSAPAETVVTPVEASPVVIGPMPEGASSAPLVQIIVNVNQAADSATIPVAPVVVPEAIEAVDPVIVVENPYEPISVGPAIVDFPIIAQPGRAPR